jgi:hypothetical protein
MNNNIFRIFFSYSIIDNGQIQLNVYKLNQLIMSTKTDINHLINDSLQILTLIINNISLNDIIILSVDSTSSTFLTPLIVAFLNFNKNKDGTIAFFYDRVEISFNNQTLIINSKDLFLYKGLIDNTLNYYSKKYNISLIEIKNGL